MLKMCKDPWVYMNKSLPRLRFTPLFLKTLLDVLVDFPGGRSKSGSFSNVKTHHDLNQQLEHTKLVDIIPVLLLGIASSDTWMNYLHVSSKILSRSLNFIGHPERYLSSVLCADCTRLMRSN